MNRFKSQSKYDAHSHLQMLYDTMTLFLSLRPFITDDALRKSLDPLANVTISAEKILKETAPFNEQLLYMIDLKLSRFLLFFISPECSTKVFLDASAGSNIVASLKYEIGLSPWFVFKLQNAVNRQFLEDKFIPYDFACKLLSHICKPVESFNANDYIDPLPEFFYNVTPKPCTLRDLSAEVLSQRMPVNPLSSPPPFGNPPLFAVRRLRAQTIGGNLPSNPQFKNLQHQTPGAQAMARQKHNVQQKISPVATRPESVHWHGSLHDLVNASQTQIFPAVPQTGNTQQGNLHRLSFMGGSQYNISQSGASLNPASRAPSSGTPMFSGAVPSTSFANSVSSLGDSHRNSSIDPKQVGSSTSKSLRPSSHQPKSLITNDSSTPFVLSQAQLPRNNSGTSTHNTPISGHASTATHFVPQRRQFHHVQDANSAVQDSPDIVSPSKRRRVRGPFSNFRQRISNKFSTESKSSNTKN